ncbi:MAG TPA: metal-dependent hydrolase [Bacillales bacterium]|nr:metal-dependent hydrolase [Bacillales bacterium]
MKITYNGHSCFLIEGDKKKIIIDPFLSGNPNNVIKLEDLKVDYIVVTHGHSDHIGDTIELAQKNNCTVISNYEISKFLSGFKVNVHPMHIGGGHTFEFGYLKLVPAIHGSGIEMADENVFFEGGHPAGILLTIGGKVLYHAGDTSLFSDMKLFGELYDINVALLPIGDNFTMGPSDAEIAATWLKAELTIPMHYNTFPMIEQDAELWVKNLKKKNLEGKVMNPGDFILIE